VKGTNTQATEEDFVFFDGLNAERERELHKLDIGEYAAVLVASIEGNRPVQRYLSAGSQEECQEFLDEMPEDAIKVVMMGDAPELVEISFEVVNCHEEERKIRRHRKGLHHEEDRPMQPEDIHWDRRPMPYTQTQIELVFLYGGGDAISRNGYVDAAHPVKALKEMSKMMTDYPTTGILFTKRAKEMLVKTPKGSNLSSLDMLNDKDRDRLENVMVEVFPTEKALFFRAGVINTMGNNILVVH